MTNDDTSTSDDGEGQFVSLPLSEILQKMAGIQPKLEDRAPDEWKNFARELDQLTSLLEDGKELLAGIVRIVAVDGVTPGMVSPILIIGVTGLVERLIRVKNTLELGSLEETPESE